MEYIEITIEDINIEEAEIILTNLGIYEYIVNDPEDIKDLLTKKHSYDWDFVDQDIIDKENAKPSITMYFEKSDEGFKKLELIKGAFPHISYISREDSEWKDRWKEYFVPTKIGSGIVVCPSWCEYTKESDEKVLILDPKMAFGTGTHESTSLCVKFLEEYVKEDMDVLDVGTGTGILAIAAKLLGAKEVLGVDIDREAVISARENIEMNKLDIKIIEGDLTKGIDFKCDILVANLIAELDILLMKDAFKHLKKGGHAIFSGILVEQEEKVTAAMIDNGFKSIKVKEDGMWCALVGGKE
jgi:ribosomal protein L11 methyltransferase